MASLREPWSDSRANQRCIDLMRSKNVRHVYHGEDIPFGLNLQPGEVWLSSPTDSLINEIEKLGINVTYSSN